MTGRCARAIKSLRVLDGSAASGLSDVRREREYRHGRARALRRSRWPLARLLRWLRGSR